MYWLFIGLSAILILPAIIFVMKSMLNIGASEELETNLEIAFLKNQLLQINKNLESGISSKDDEFNRNSISRRILKLHQSTAIKTEFIPAPKKITKFIVICISLMCIFGTHLTYLITGDSFFDSQNMINVKLGNFKTEQNQQSQETIEAKILTDKNPRIEKELNLELNSFKSLVEELKTALENRPNDLQGQKLLVKNSFQIGDFSTARKAQKKVLELLESEAKSSDYSKYAELCIIAASGYVSPEAEAAIETAISLNQKNSQANFYLSLLQLQKQKFSPAFETWVKLLQNEPSSSKWINILVQQIENFSANLGANLIEGQQLTSEYSGITFDFLKVLTALEQRLNQYEEPIEAWASLITSYQNLKFLQKAEVKIKNFKSQYPLLNSQVEQLGEGLKEK